MSEHYSVVYSPKAREDLLGIGDYIAYILKAPLAADHITKLLREQAKSLSSFPERHPLMENEPWKAMNMRRLPVKNYVIFYTVSEPAHMVTIIRIVYGGRDLKGIANEITND